MPKGTPGRPACSIDGCERTINGRGLCSMHYHRWKRYGDPLREHTIGDVPTRFWSYVDKTGDCWNWMGGRDLLGYGGFHISQPTKRRVLAHRFAYELLVGLIPEGLELDHLCRNTSCVNPAHLEPVTHAENMRRASNHWRNRTECLSGHPWDAENTYLYNGRRMCRACHARRYQAGKARALNQGANP